MPICASRRTVGTVGVFFVVGLAVAGGACRGTSRGASAADQPIGITKSQLFVTIENRAGLSLMDLRVNIIPVGRATTFTATWTRLETGEKRDFSLGEFRGRDGTPLNLRIHRPQRIVVTGVDINQKSYEVESSW